jgi:hypothetical protein
MWACLSSWAGRLAPLYAADQRRLPSKVSHSRMLPPVNPRLSRYRQRVDAEDPDGHGDRAEADAAPAAEPEAATARHRPVAATVFDVFDLAIAFPFHHRPPVYRVTMVALACAAAPPFSRDSRAGAALGEAALNGG